METLGGPAGQLQDSLRIGFIGILTHFGASRAKIIGFICTYSFELLQPTKGAPQHGLFESASLMNHDCIGNTRYVQYEK